MPAQTGETPVPKNKPAYADVYYTDAKDERQSLDFYLPRQSDELAPVIVYIHGGAWTVGSKADVGQNSYPQCSHAWCAARGREDGGDAAARAHRHRSVPRESQGRQSCLPRVRQDSAYAAAPWHGRQGDSLLHMTHRPYPVRTAYYNLRGVTSATVSLSVAFYLFATMFKALRKGLNMVAEDSSV